MYEYVIRIFKYSVIWILLSNQKTFKQYTVGDKKKIVLFFIERLLKETCHKQKIMHGLINMNIF